MLLVSRGLAAQTVTRGPYLQLQTPTGAVVRWRTDLATDSRVRFGTVAGSPSAHVSDPSLTTEHVVALTGLAPETQYFYSVGTATALLAGGDTATFFRTAPPPGVSRPIRIWALGDSGTADGNAGLVRDAYLALAPARRTDVWVMLGDNAYTSGTDAEYQAAVFDMYTGVLRNTFLWPTLGNHDGLSSISSTQTGPYFDMFTLPALGQAGGVPSGTEAYYSFNYANVHFVCLDSYGSSRAAGSPMLTWLANDLAANASSWTVAYWHHPPYSKGSHDSDVETELIEMRQNVGPILEAAGVDLVLSGHSHSYERSYLLDGHYGLSSTLIPSMKLNAGSGRDTDTGPYVKPAGIHPHNGTVYVVAGSGARLGGGTLDHPAMFVSLAQLGSLAIDIDEDRLDARFVTSSGAVADRFTIIRSSRFHTLTACRLLDTRLAPGVGGGPAVAAGARRMIPVAGRCGIPASARSIAANVTATSATAAGHLTALPDGAAAPATTSTVNFRSGQTRANNARVAVGPGGAILLESGMSAGQVDAIVDVTGYFD